VIAGDHVGVFNPTYREALKGQNDQGTGGGYIFNQINDLFPVRVGSRGSIRFADNSSQPLPNLWDQMFAADPEQSVNYVSAHDNLILRDKILAWAALNGVQSQTGYLKRIQEFAGGIILTSQAIPFMEAGDEMLRDKHGNANSYNAPDSINEIHWNWKIDNADVFDYYRHVIALRKSHPGLRMTTWQEIDKNVQTEQPRHGVVVNKINGSANGDTWQNIVVIYNSADNYEYPLPSGAWRVAMERSDPQAGNDRSVTGKVVAEGTAVTVVHQ